METPKITVNEALIIAKEYHLETEVTECIKHRCSKCGKIKLKYGIKIEIKC